MTARPIRILQFGTTGQLARALCRAVSARDDVQHAALSRSDADFRDLQRLEDVFAAARPFDIVINAAAYTAVDRAESEPEIARAVNALAPAKLAEICERRGVPLIHISTDYV